MVEIDQKDYNPFKKLTYYRIKFESGLVYFKNWNWT